MLTLCTVNIYNEFNTLNFYINRRETHPGSSLVSFENLLLLKIYHDVQYVITIFSTTKIISIDISYSTVTFIDSKKET